MLRSNSRVQNIYNENFPFNPIIFYSKERYAYLLIKHYHEKLYHGNHETVINELRHQFWIIGLRQKLRSIVAHCSVCKLLKGKPVQPQMAALPAVRLGHKLRVFTYCGLDYFGPFRVKIGCFIEKR